MVRFRPAAKHIAARKKRAAAARVPLVYANGWLARAVVDMLMPGDDDYFVLKPANSAFFHTALESLLEHLGARELVVAGVRTTACSSPRTTRTSAATSYVCRPIASPRRAPREPREPTCRAWL